jgi:hypothetical protein
MNSQSRGKVGFDVDRVMVPADKRHSDLRDFDLEHHGILLNASNLESTPYSALKSRRVFRQDRAGCSSYARWRNGRY